MSRFIDIIKNLLNGILSFFTGLLRGKKSQPKQLDDKAAEKPVIPAAKPRKSRGYFLELDEAGEVNPANGSKPKESEAKAKPPEPPKQTKSPEPVAAAKKPEPAKAAKSSEPPTAKAASDDALADKIKQVELVQTAEGVKAELVEPAQTKKVSDINKNQPETTFAPKYLIPSATKARRRPGPNMNPFLDMARQVKPATR